MTKPAAPHLQDEPPRDGLPPAARRAAMAAVMLAVMTATLDTAIVNTALPRIALDLHTDAETSIWVVNAYQLAVLATLLPLAALGEIIGHRLVYLAGLILFTASSILCGLAWSLPVLALARLVQGLGASAVVAVNLALIRHIYPSRLLGRGVGMNALFVGMSFTAGPSVASLILSVASWHWLFLVNGPVGLLAFTLGLRALPKVRLAAHKFDAIAAGLTAGTFSLLLLALDSAGHGSDVLLSIAALLGAFACLALLLHRQSGHPAPMLALDLFRIPVFALSAVTAVCAFATQGISFVALPFLFQSVLGRSQVEAGLLLTPWPAIVAALAPVSGRLADRYSTGVLGFIGLATLGLGMALLATMPDDPSTIGIILRLLLCGAGFGFFQAPNLKALMGSAPPARAGGASGIVSTARNLGQASGAALVALCFNISPQNGPLIALWLGGGSAGIAAIASLLRVAATRRPPSGA